MIPIDKGPVPAGLDELNEELTAENMAIYQKHHKSYKISSAKTKGAKAACDTIYITAAYRAAAVKNALVQTHHGKCAYCETRILNISHGDVEHFRPKGKYTGEEQTGLGYFWLAYEWSNLFLACDICNEAYKGTYFALLPAVEGLIEPSVRLEPGEGVADSEENAVLIDPATENPRAYIEFNPRSGEIGASPKASQFPVAAARVGKMVRALGLDRPDLVAARYRHMAFLRSMFIIACQDLPSKTKRQEDLKGLLQAIENLKADEGNGQASQKALYEICAGIYTIGAAGDLWKMPDPGENAAEAMRWVAFCISPRAEYSALSQDCILDWSRKLVGASVPAAAATMSTPPSTAYGSTGNVPVWPPLPVAPIGMHIKTLDYALAKYEESKVKQSQDMREAARQMYYNELNELVTDINTFHTEEFDASEAEDRYMAWSVDLQVLNGELDALDAVACAAQRDKLLEFLNQKMFEAGTSGLPDSDRNLNDLWSQFTAWCGQVEPLEIAWQGAVQMVTLGMEIAASLRQCLDDAMRTSDLSPAVSQGATFDVLEKLAEFAPALIPLSPQFERGITTLQANYDDWLKRTSTQVQRQNAAQAFLNANIAKRAQLITLVQTYSPHLKTILAVFQKARDLRASADNLAQRYSNAGIAKGTWRMNTLDYISNMLHDMQDARTETKGVLIDKSQALVPPQPTLDSPSQHTVAAQPHQYRPEPAIKWAVSTARKKLNDFLAGRAKLKVKRKLTAKQQAELTALEELDKRIGALITQLQAEALAQQSVIASFDDGSIEHFASTQ